MTLDDLDRRLLDAAQSGFPVTPRPFDDLGEQLGVSGDEVIARFRRLVEAGTVREIGPAFNLRLLGCRSTLCAAGVDPARIDPVAAAVSAFGEVTHNYLRDDPELNLWFTVIAPGQERLDEVLDLIRREPGVSRVLSFPMEKQYKIQVHFDAGRDAP